MDRFDARHERPLRYGKQGALLQLGPSLHDCRVPHGAGIAWRDWRLHRAASLARIVRELRDGLVAVRSDRLDEGSPSGAHAGRYRTVLGVAADDAEAVADAIDSVFASYETPRVGDGVFVQRQVTDVRHAAVVLGHTMPDGAPYLVVSIAPGPRSDRVTGGDAAVETWYISHDRCAQAALPVHCRRCVDAYLEVEALAGEPADIELVIDNADRAWLLQARALTPSRAPAAAVIARRHEVELALGGRRDVLLGQMPDWNPAELIGEHPRPLARTLFERLIGCRAWRLARERLGYRHATTRPLLQTHAGRPYVDVRLSLASLLPRGLDTDLAERLLDAQCARLREQPELHDKVEFEIAFSAPVCSMAAQFSARYPDVFTPPQYRSFGQALGATAQRLFDPAITARLVASFERTLAEAAEPVRDLDAFLFRLELRCAVHFAMVARLAFAGEALLRSAIAAGALDAAVLENERRRACAAMHGTIGDDDGAVRAGTFEIEAPARRSWSHGRVRMEDTIAAASAAPLDAAARTRLREALREARVDVEPEAFLAQHANAVFAREFGKHALASGVSRVLDALTERAAARGIDASMASWLRLDDLLGETGDLESRAEAARKSHAVDAMLRMPLLMDSPRLDVVHHRPGSPNYLGRGRVDGRIVVVDEYSAPHDLPIRSLVAIASANPGFDWVFARRPLALVTAFGGPNSHIAIRCAHANVPALLGVGPESFRRLIAAGRIAIDFDARLWSPV